MAMIFVVRNYAEHLLEFLAEGGTLCVEVPHVRGVNSVFQLLKVPSREVRLFDRETMPLSCLSSIPTLYHAPPHNDHRYATSKAAPYQWYYELFASPLLHILPSSRSVSTTCGNPCLTLTSAHILCSISASALSSTISSKLGIKIS